MLDKRILIILVLSCFSFAFPGGATTYYVGPNGRSSNTGLSTNSPWDMTTALGSVQTSNTIMVMDGTYQGQEWTVSTPHLTIKAMNKWKAQIINSPGSTFVISATDWSVPGVVFDGLCISNSASQSILFWSGSNHVIRNCWIQWTGKFATSAAGTASGFTAVITSGSLFENNLVEWNGNASTYAGLNHGMYISSGTNNTIRNNVCRYNNGLGIDLPYETGYGGNWGCDYDRVYNNLCYSNCFPKGYTVGTELRFTPEYGGTHNYVYNNTFVSCFQYAIQVQDGGAYFTNNIIISAGQTPFYPSGTVVEDYNLCSGATGYGGVHDKITNNFNFVNPAKGLFWLSKPNGAAISSMCGPENFFGASQTSVTDIGAFQYSSVYAADTRVLDPSPANPDYWAILGVTSNSTPAITVTPASQNFGSIPVGSTTNRNFTVQNTGSGTLTGSATVSSPFSILSGGSYSLGASQSQTVTVSYSPTVAGSNSQTISFSGASGASATVTGIATNASVSKTNSLTFAASSGVISSPFVLANGYIYQSVVSGVTNGGRAAYTFVVTNTGSYVVQALVNAPNLSSNSFYVNIDAEPQDPLMTWDIMPVTSGFEQRVVAWRGNGTAEADQFVPKVFILTQGTHQLIIRGREANTLLQSLSILQLPASPQRLRVASSP